MPPEVAAATAAGQLDWQAMLLPQLPWMEKLARPLIVFAGLILLFRIGGKRALAQATLFDFVVLLLIANVVQNAMIGDDNSVLGAGVGAAALMAASTMLSRVSARHRAARKLLEGSSELLINNGEVDHDAIRKLEVNEADLKLAVRKAGFCRYEDVGFAVLELDGTISVMEMPSEGDDRPPTALPGELGGQKREESDV